MNSIHPKAESHDPAEELVTLFKRDHNTEALNALFVHYRPLILSRIRYYGFLESEAEDLCQECLVGLYSAILHYNPQKSSFGTFARLCIDRMLISVIRSKNRARNIPRESLVDFDESLHLGAVEQDNPEQILEQFDNFSQLLLKIKNALSAFEYSVLLQSFSGMSYSEISVKLGVSVKAVDNAVQRIRRKFSKL